MPNSNTYLAITIGPIYATQLRARKPKELWLSSYLFSYLMRSLLEAMHKENWTVLSPHYAPLADADKYGAGLVTDRIFVQCQGTEYNDMTGLIDGIDNDVEGNERKDGIFDKLSKEWAKRIGADKEEVKVYFKQYLRLHYLEYPLPKVDPEASIAEQGKQLTAQKKAQAEIIATLNQYLDTLELHHLPVGEDRDFLTPFFKRINNSFLVRDAYGKNHPILKDQGRFPSVPEFAAKELLDQLEKVNQNAFQQLKYTHLLSSKPSAEVDQEENEDALYTQLKASFPDDFRAYHKYLALVKADGDNIGKTLAAIGEVDDNALTYLREFSKNLYSFGKESARLIHEYGGNPVLIGGDDLLFFTPLKYDQKSVFELVKELVQKFKTLVIDHLPKVVLDKLAKNQQTPSLSFGIHFAYYRYPLYEALKEVADLLDDAKEKLKRNAIAFALRKHSGQVIRSGFKADSNAFNEFIKILNTHTNGEAQPYFNSIAHKLSSIQVLLDGVATDQTRLDAFFTRQFNEPIHEQNQEFTEQLKDFIKHLFADAGQLPLYEKNQERGKGFSSPALEQLYACLRTIHFFNDKHDRDEE